MIDRFKKARNSFTGFFIIVLVILVNSNFKLNAIYYIPQTNILGFSNGIYYDNLEDLNNFFIINNFPAITSEFQYYSSINFRTNFIPILFDDSHSIIYSVDIRLPYNREFNNSDYNIKLNTYSYFIELSAFESFLRNITVHPFVGLGYSNTFLEIDSKNTANIFLQKVNSDEEHFEFNKSTLLFNLGGGIDYRKNIMIFEKSKINLLFSFNARYSMCLDAYRINDSEWKYNEHRIEQIPKYYAPGLSIEFAISLEYQIR